MELTVTEPIFLWLFGAVAVLVLILLGLFVVLAVHAVRLVKFANEQSRLLGAAIGEVRSATHDASESLRSTSQHVAQFVSFTTSAAGIAKLFAGAREAWTSWSGGSAGARNPTTERRRKRRQRSS